jgi:putative oxidoreductase
MISHDPPPPPRPPVKIWSHPEFRHWRSAPLATVCTSTARIALAGVFLYAGTLKALDPQEFLLDVRSFQMLPDPWAAWLALGLPWVEIICALALLLGGWTRGACLVFTGMLIVFAAAFIQAWVRGIDVTCGCFGKTENKTNFTQSLAIDAALLALTAFVWWSHSRLQRRPPTLK